MNSKINMSTMLERDQCDLCGNSQFTKLYNLDWRIVVKCKECGLVFVQQHDINPKFDNIMNDNDYRKYFESNFLDFRLKSYYKALEHLIVLLNGIQGKRVLDLGSSFGFFLTLAKNSGMIVEGIEGSNYEAQIAEREKLIPTTIANLNELQLKSEVYDLVTLWDVLEHLNSPQTVLKKVYCSLKKEGILLVRVPSRDGLIPILSHLIYRFSFGRISFPIKKLFEFHQYHFNTKTIKSFLIKNNFTVVDIYYEHYINPDVVNKKDYGSNLLLSGILQVVIRMARILNLQDEIVIYARK